MEIQALNLNQLFKLTKVLKKMGLKYNLTDFIFGDKFDQQLKKMNVTAKDKKNVIFVNILVFFLENMHLAQNEIYDLIADYKKINVKVVSNYTIDDFLPILFELITGSFPKNMNVLVMANIEQFKKKIFSMVREVLEQEKS